MKFLLPEKSFGGIKGKAYAVPGKYLARTSWEKIKWALLNGGFHEKEHHNQQLLLMDSYREIFLMKFAENFNFPLGETGDVWERDSLG